MSLLQVDQRAPAEEWQAADLADELAPAAGAASRKPSSCRQTFPRADAADLAASWERCLAEFGYPEARDDRAAPCIAFPVFGWSQAPAALELLSADVRRRIADAEDRGAETVMITLSAPVEAIRQAREPQRDTRPAKSFDTPEPTPFDIEPAPAPVAAFDDARNMNEAEDAYLPTRDAIIAETAEIRATWSPAQFRAASGYKLKKWRVPKVRSSPGSRRLAE